MSFVPIFLLTVRMSESLYERASLLKKTDHSHVERVHKQPACSAEIEGTFAGRKSPGNICPWN